MKHIYYVSILVIRPYEGSHQLLMGKRAEGKYMGGTWQLISGGIESGETAWQAATRELDEETGLRSQEWYRLSTLTHFYRPDNDSLNTAPMFCAIISETDIVRINDEHSAYEWVAIEQAATRLMWPGDRQALDELQTVILQNGLAKAYMRIDMAK